MTIFALDTNTLSYLLKNDAQVCSRMADAIHRGDDCIIPPVSYYEIKRGLLYSNATAKLNFFEGMCHAFSIGVMDMAAWNEAARLYAQTRRQGHPIEDADLFIAAFCLAGKYALVTNNTKHFEIITELSCVNWT
ncbi:MAG: PIN domain-containing protein [Desulfovibrio sp.]|jgi:predicted nucleic acid-binding protein|nr:PIN domain-containing protein [Desulfovibrio sp.]